MALSLPTVSTLQEPIILQCLDSCKSMQDLKQIQSLVLKSQHLQTHLVFSKILSFSALSPCGNISHARNLLAHLENPTISMYNVVIRGGISIDTEGPKSSSMLTYQELLEMGLLPDNFTFPPLIKSFIDCRALFEAQLIHAHVVKMGFEPDDYVRNNLMRLYSVCGEIGHARKLFDRFPDRDLVSWTTLISGYSKLGFSKEAVSIFWEMVDEDLAPDAVIMAIVISACSRIGDLELAMKLHSYIDTYKVDFDVFVWNALVDMYSKCGDIRAAYNVFTMMPQRNVVSWNSIISGLARNGEFKEAMSLFRRMQSAGLKPDGMTLVCVLNSCASLNSLELGRWIHSYTKRLGITTNGIVGNALVDMYTKCGEIDQAMGVFATMDQRDVCTYTTLITGFAMNGEATKALELFSRMSTERIKPNAVTFIGVLSACSHAGLVDVGFKHFHDMSRFYGITPQIEHYGCVIDMLGRAGLLDKAQEFISKMPIEPDPFIWGALLGACKVHGNIELAERITKKLLELDSSDDGAHVLMSNMYTSARQKEKANLMRKVMKSSKVRKTPGCSLIEVDGVVHEFRVRDKAHPQRREIYMAVELIDIHLRCERYNSLSHVS